MAAARTQDGPNTNGVEAAKFFGGLVRVPADAATLQGFRRWATSADFPAGARISYIAGELVIDMSPEELETHNRVKVEVSAVIRNLNVVDDLGLLYGDRTLLTNEAADLSTEPDAIFATWRTIRGHRVVQTPRAGHPGQSLELQGSPDWVLEIVSEYSVPKDSRDLFGKYFVAGIREYWLIDARGDAISFQILKRGRNGFNPVSPQGGWRRSPVFGRRFRLDRKRHPLGPLIYTLHVKR